MVLVNLMRAQEVDGSPLFRLARLLTRLEDLSHVLVWADPEPAREEGLSGGAEMGTSGPQSEYHRITLVELPRLKLR